MELQSSLQDVATPVRGREAGEASRPFAHAEFHPTDEGGTAMSLGCLGASELLLFCGDGPARWELDWTNEDVKFVKDVVRAVCTGHSTEVHALGRIHVEVSLPDGSTVEAATYVAPSGLLPLPGWKKWGRRT